MPQKTMDKSWRDHTAHNLLRGPASDTIPASIRIDGGRFKGWLYIGVDAVVFIANDPMSDRGSGGTNGERIVHVTYSDLGSASLTARCIAPTATVEFSNGMTFAGQKRQIKALHKLLST